MGDKALEAIETLLAGFIVPQTGRPLGQAGTRVELEEKDGGHSVRRAPA